MESVVGYIVSGKDDSPLSWTLGICTKNGAEPQK